MLALPSMAPHRARLERYHFGAVRDVSRWLVYDERAVDVLHARLSDQVRNTDMNRFLEYSTPRYQSGPGRAEENIIALLSLLPATEAATRRGVLLANRR
jgi:hypothetical protein